MRYFRNLTPGPRFRCGQLDSGITWQRRCIVAARYRRAVMSTPFGNRYPLARSGNDDA
jgi:hypothetical protein